MGRSGCDHVVRAAACALLLAAAPAAAETVLNVGAFGADANKLDPFLSGGGQDRALFGYVLNGVTRFPPGSMDPARIELDLAERYEASEDGRVWTFTLRDGVAFHHGYGTLSAADIVYSLNRVRDPKTSGFAQSFAAIETVEAVDPRTVRITLERNVPTLLGMLADPSGGLIVSAKASAALGEDVKARLVGTGPFAFESYTPKQQSTLVAHGAYFRGKPQIDKIVYRYIPSDNARELAFAAGEIDLFYGRREQDWVDRMRRQHGAAIKIDVFAPSQSRIIHLNMAKPPLDDLRVRQAIAHAIDRSEFQALVGPDITVPLESPVPSGFLGQTTDVPRYPFDQARARALLAEAGRPNGVTLPVLTSQIASLRVPFELVMEQLRRVGITLATDFVDHAAWHQRIRRDESAVVIYGAAPFPIADAFLTPFFHGRTIVGTPTAETNFSHCAVADAEIDAARSEVDPARRDALWAEAQRRIMAEVCAVPIFELMQVWARRATLDYGYELTGTLNLGPPITETTRLVR